MTVSIPKPYWRVVNGVRERATALAARVTSRVAADDKGHSDMTKADEWSAVMAQSSTAPIVAMPSVVAPATVAPEAVVAPAATQSVATAPIVTAPVVAASVVTAPVVAPTVAAPVAAAPVAPSAVAPRAVAPIAATAPIAAAAASTARPVNAPARHRDVNSAWVLTVMVLLVCGATTGWLFAHGTAAAAWLIALLVVALGGVPIGLVALRLFGYEDSD
jgi:hypothetical protein